MVNQLFAIEQNYHYYLYLYKRERNSLENSYFEIQIKNIILLLLNDKKFYRES